MEADEVDVVTAAVFCDFEEVENSEEAGSASEMRSDVGKADGLDGVDFDLAFFHAIALAHGDARARPDADADGDLTAANASAETLREYHGAPRYMRGRS